jgi:hypothetical protein
MGTKYTGKDGTVGSWVVDTFEVTEEANIATFVDTTTAGWEDNEPGARKWSGTFHTTEPTNLATGAKVEDVRFFTGAEHITGDIRIVTVACDMDRSGQKISGNTVTFSGCGAMVKATGSGT